MYAIYYCVPDYDSRDSYCGSIIYRDTAFPYAFETAALALRKMPEPEGDGEIYYFVADAADPFRKVLKNYTLEDEIPF